MADRSYTVADVPVREENVFDREPPCTWPRWRDKCGIAHALRTYFPETLASNEQLRFVLMQMETAERTIESIMSEGLDR